MIHGGPRTSLVARRLAAAVGAACLVVATTMATAPRLSAQTEVPPEAVAEVAAELNCPVCQGYTLKDCPLELCAQMRDLIRERLERGESRQQIMDAFVEEYGPQVLNAPPRGGFYSVAWLLPIVALALGVLAVALFLRRTTRPALPVAAGGTDGAPAADSTFLARFERLAAADSQPAGDAGLKEGDAAAAGSNDAE